MEFLFKNLIVWQKAMELAKLVYCLVKQFPAEERYALELGYVGGDSGSRSTMDEIYSRAEEVSRMLTTMLKKYGPLEKEN